MKASRLGYVVMVGLSIGIPAAAIVPKFIEAREAGKPTPGTPVIYEGEVGAWSIVEVTDDSYVIRNYTLPETDKTVKKDEVAINDRWTDEKYRWYSIFH